MSLGCLPFETSRLCRLPNENERKLLTAVGVACNDQCDPELIFLFPTHLRSGKSTIRWRTVTGFQ